MLTGTAALTGTAVPTTGAIAPDGRSLVGRHVRLDPTVLDDAPGLFAVLDDARVWAANYGGGPAARPADVEAMRVGLIPAVVAREGGPQARGVAYRVAYTVRLVADSDLGAAGTVVGTTSLGDVDVVNERAHLGWTAYGPDWWASTVNPECKLLLLSHAFEDCGLGRVKIQTDLVNTRSQAAIAKLGATREGVLRRHARRADGTFRDTVVYSIVRDEWPVVREQLSRRLMGPRAVGPSVVADTANDDRSCENLRRLLVDVVDAQDWTLLERTVEEHWVSLVCDSWRELRTAVAAVPPASLVAGGYLRLAADMLLLLPLGATQLPGSEAEEAGQAVGSASPDRRLEVTTGVAQVATLRRTGRFAESLALMDRVERMCARAATSPERLRDVLPVAWLQLGVSRLLAGDLDAAPQLFSRARRAPTTPTTSFVARNSANSLALVLALDGDLPHAQDWLAMAESEPEARGWLEPMVRVTGLIAAALTATDELDEETSFAALRALGTATGPDEHWAFILWAQTRHTLSWGDPQEMVRTVDAAANVHRRQAGSAGAGQALLLAARLDLHVALGRGNAALALLNQAEGHRLAAVSVARAQMLTDHPDAALMTLARVRQEAVHGVHAVELLVVLAQVNLRLGDGPAAGAAFRRATLVAGASGAVRPFTTIQATEREQLVELAKESGEAGSFRSVTAASWDRVRAARQVFPSQLMAVTLSEREQLVLRRLAGGLTGEQIAQTLFVSLNTVKSQIRSVYRKLEVTSRSAAVARAYTLGLLSEHD